MFSSTKVFYCVYKTGGDFTREYVERLKEGVDKHLGWEFRCLSDDPEVPGYIPLEHGWDGWWSKMELFRPDLDGDILYADLDTVLCGDMSPFDKVCRKAGFPIMLSDFYFPDRLASGLMWLPKVHRAHVWNRWLKIKDNHSFRGDQELIAKCLGHFSFRWQKILPFRVASYKLHVTREGVPKHILDNSEPMPLDDVSVVCYHGRPRPHETGWEGV